MCFMSANMKLLDLHYGDCATPCATSTNRRIAQQARLEPSTSYQSLPFFALN